MGPLLPFETIHLSSSLSLLHREFVQIKLKQWLWDDVFAMELVKGQQKQNAPLTMIALQPSNQAGGFLSRALTLTTGEGEFVGCIVSGDKVDELCGEMLAGRSRLGNGVMAELLGGVLVVIGEIGSFGMVSVLEKGIFAGLFLFFLLSTCVFLIASTAGSCQIDSNLLPSTSFPSLSEIFVPIQISMQFEACILSVPCPIAVVAYSVLLICILLSIAISPDIALASDYHSIGFNSRI
ncbi:uncharacterized protein G2W53_029351 [Senna tora]|uniref:Uncharacterized protein n=1 Tax=Senna tora TaxID=362788 RepID=A0A834T530_9FABA|nr:uncharacterized protein G2W53_029351 [Senna tora]